MTKKFFENPFPQSLPAVVPKGPNCPHQWKDGLLKFSFWTLNGGLMAMCVLSLLLVDLMQTWASVEQRGLTKVRRYWRKDKLTLNNGS